MNEQTMRKEAESMLEIRGLRPTPRLLSAVIMTLDKAQGQARLDGLMETEAVGQAAASHVIGNIGLGECLKIADENPGLAARRINHAGLVDPPSVQDVAEAAVHHVLVGIGAAHAQAVRTQQ